MCFKNVPGEHKKILNVYLKIEHKIINFKNVDFEYKIY